jgi:hypothetical protein
MAAETLHIFLAENDQDDHLLFEDALKEVSQAASLTVACDGQELMALLREKTALPPSFIFLDLNI